MSKNVNTPRELAKSTGVRRDAYSELPRREGRRRDRRAVEVKDIDGVIQQVRETNAYGTGEAIGVYARTE